MEAQRRAKVWPLGTPGLARRNDSAVAVELVSELSQRSGIEREGIFEFKTSTVNTQSRLSLWEKKERQLNFKF